MDTNEVQRLRDRNAWLESELNQKNRALEIETALENVSTRIISMRESAELLEVSAVLLQQLKILGIDAIRTGVGIFDDPNDAMELWLTSASNSEEVLKILEYINLHIHPVFENIIPARKQNKPFVVTVLRGSEVVEYYQMMSTYLSMPGENTHAAEEYFYSFFFSQGSLNLITCYSLTNEETRIMVQFAEVVGLIYKRFLDLQQAELQTKEAFRQTALDRVRAEIASMRTADDLNRITPLIWRELENLGVPFFRCGVFIINEERQSLQAYLSTPQGASLGVLHLSFDSTETIREVVNNWRQQRVHSEQWNSQMFQDWVQSLVELGQVKEADKFKATESPLDLLSLHFIPFSQGMLYVGSEELLDESQIDLIKSLADSFSVAYARYADFKKLEVTLSELRTTQSQLIQSEKMASLGELTAGIAHEIQNPLNFVNNFSEVNSELIKEIQDIRHKTQDGTRPSEEDQILNDITQNLEKINHHGRRAADIVKGMLQHSRSSSGVKEPTNINALADEYLRLAYHGLRAKDKSFTAMMKTDFDESIGSINIIPQDIGRVILNLITNAFYVVNEKFKVESSKSGSSYEPTVTVSTKKEGNKILITVKDNGNGIPDHIKDKIFQPFFTTKPTGQGTGLGLSLSYDIVKAHGGELRVETKEGVGSEFNIVLPFS